MYQAAFIVLPVGTGITSATPREAADKMSILLAIGGLMAGIYAISLAKQGKDREALIADFLSVSLDSLSILSALRIL